MTGALAALRLERRSAITSRLRRWWERFGALLLWPTLLILTVLAALKLSDEFRRLVWEAAPGAGAAIDLDNFHILVRQWFAGIPVYNDAAPALYPPASLVLLWPLVGWLDLPQARWLWAGVTAAALVWLIAILVRESGATRPLERAFVALMVLSMNAVGVTIGVGQLGLYLLPMLLAVVLTLHRGRPGWRWELLAAGVLILTLVKPTFSAPFFWLVVLAPRGLRTALLVACGYAAATAIAASFQGARFVGLLEDFLAHSSATAAKDGYGNIQIALATLGQERWMALGSGLALAALGIWTLRYRHVDVWLLLGVAALTARMWTYHRVYDDTLILLPMIALFRIAKRGPRADGRDVLAGVLLAITLLAMLAPARLFNPPGLGGLDATLPLAWVFPALHVVIWVVLLGFLMDQARRDANARVELIPAVAKPSQVHSVDPAEPAYSH